MKTQICNECEVEKELTKEFWHIQIGNKYGFRRKCKICINKENRENRENREIKENINKKQKCSKCKKEKALTFEIWQKRKCSKTGFRNICKECLKTNKSKYYKENKEEISKKQKKYYKENKEEISKKTKKNREENKEKHTERSKRHYKNNKDKIKKKSNKWSNSPANYKTYVSQLFADRTRNDNGILEVKCHYCKEWFKATNRQAQSRINAINGKKSAHNYFYCSQNCKEKCDNFGLKSSFLIKQDNINAGIYKEHKHEAFYDSYKLSIWASEVKKQAKYECEICKKKENLEAHHINPKSTHPEIALDPANGICLCEKCHDIEHQKEGMRTGELKKVDIKTCIRKPIEDV